MAEIVAEGAFDFDGSETGPLPVEVAAVGAFEEDEHAASD